jgi:hypothetical protein
LKQESLERLPSITKALDRALSNASEEDYAREHIRVPPGDLRFWHYYDLEDSLMKTECWKDYFSQEARNEISQRVTARPDAVMRIIGEYRSWAALREPSTEVQRNVFRDLSTLHELSPEAFPRSLVTLTDQEYREVGLQQIGAAMDSTQRIMIHAKLAELDPERFRAIFGSEYTAKELSAKRKYYERWEWENPLKVPKRSSYLKVIERCMTDT